ncbi:hypothetical protein R2Q81_05225 [Microbacterium aquimaris]|uniref:cytidine deaminase family protein n=1 Tax=Microbacterium aquimaris TaxID=459816 RepID=UPI002AD2C6BE|nr:hypothetical protein [Microbacterium aquimaris]MDZ8275353.1 hypothetical protein [Microbacterium aquimaris]
MTTTLTMEDQDLVDAAGELLRRAHDAELHRVAVAARGGSGKVYMGLSLRTPRESVCAESSAIANAKMAGETTVETIAAVGLAADDTPVVVNPCGLCREMVPVFSPEIRVIVNDGEALRVASRSDLLPLPWVRARNYA